MEINPCIAAPNRDFLVGTLMGYNAGRRSIEENPKPTINNQDITVEDFFIGYWLELTCGNCGAFYTFDSPNHLPTTNLICQCGNHVIVYNVNDTKLMKIGAIIF